MFDHRRIDILKDQPLLDKGGKKTLYSRVRVAPFPQGQALTVANVVRQVLLQHVDSVGIESVQIRGVYHEFSTLPGVKESVQEILNNLRNLVFSVPIDQPTIVHGYIHFRGAGLVCARHIVFPNQPGLVCLEGDMPLFHSVSQKATMALHITFTRSKGYSFCTTAPSLPASSWPKEPFLPVDTAVVPVQKVNYVLERFGWYESIVFEIWTNGSIKPVQALAQASFFIRYMFRPFTCSSSSFD